MAKDLPRSRVRRAAKVGRLAGGQAARGYVTKATNLTRDEEGRRAAAERRQMEAAEQIFDVLGQMKGAAMKVGQVASFIDTGAFPPEFQERIQAKLAELRDAAPRVPFERMKKVVEDDLGEKLGDVFSEFGEDAVAAASIGQVYRGRLHDGREVAVKVQYPGVGQAVRADLQNLGLIMRVAKRIAPGMDAKAMTAEIRERLTDELDYEHEAQQHRAFARSWRGHPFIFVPPVVTELCTEHVLVTEWVEGIGFEEIKELDDETRDRFGEIVFRFFFGSLYRNGHFSGDPHPGNYRLMDDGRVAFIDFGMTKRVAREDIDAEVDALRLAMDGDVEGLFRRLGAMGFFDPEDPQITPEAVYDHFHDVTAWYIEDREVTIDRELVSQVLIDFGDPRSRHWQLMKRETMPPQSMLARRMEALTLGVLGQLEATANWHLIAREWLFGEAPSTELGELEEPFHDRAAA
ncbi:MAG TPA: AarF/ABC1/UbiB kinase family protein [Thermoleophilaceae bacterium]|jgi:predicted unusual protein kinase regulating ubiquinone biosynthesis (AarF/ABC1/UbiB family)|nr:AarF/ABC1/UbiB kinase family protein [Thermoleophilaceae bacterium]